MRDRANSATPPRRRVKREAERIHATVVLLRASVCVRAREGASRRFPRRCHARYVADRAGPRAAGIRFEAARRTTRSARVGFPFSAVRLPALGTVAFPVPCPTPRVPDTNRHRAADGKGSTGPSDPPRVSFSHFSAGARCAYRGSRRTGVDGRMRACGGCSAWTWSGRLAARGSLAGALRLLSGRAAGVLVGFVRSACARRDTARFFTPSRRSGLDSPTAGKTFGLR